MGYRQFLSLVVSVSFAFPAYGEVDQSPLHLDILKAFPEISWPQDLTGQDRGMQIAFRPLVVTGAGDGTNRLFFATQLGTIHAIENNSSAKEASIFLDLRDRVELEDRQNEEGLLGLAFHPKFKENGQFFVNYTASRKNQPLRKSIVSRFTVLPNDPNRGDPTSERILLEVNQPYWNHNGGTVVFGPDGYLYIVFGDGGLANDPHMHGQNLQSLLSKVLRIDVDRTERGLDYAIPPDNPFVGHGSLARPEIWAYGLRNVWRLSFDRKTGTAWGADVGQELWEEINIIRRGGNYGWNLREGKHPFGPGGSKVSQNYIEPIWEYDHSYGKSITGGHVYRGKQVPELEGAYLYADYVSGRIWALWYDESKKVVTANRSIRGGGPPVVTFGEDDHGEVYFTNELGDVYKFASPNNIPEEAR